MRKTLEENIAELEKRLYINGRRLARFEEGTEKHTRLKYLGLNLQKKLDRFKRMRSTRPEGPAVVKMKPAQLETRRG